MVGHDAVVERAVPVIGLRRAAHQDLALCELVHEVLRAAAPLAATQEDLLHISLGGVD